MNDINNIEDVRVTKLTYAEDLTSGMVVRQIRQQLPPGVEPGTLQAAFSMPREVVEWVNILEVRRYGEIISCITVRPNGEQWPLYCHLGQLIEVADSI